MRRQSASAHSPRFSRSRNDEAEPRVAALLDERRKQERDLGDLRRKIAAGGEASATEIAGVSYVGRAVSGIETKDLKALVDEEKQRLGSGVVAMVAVAADGKAGVVVGVTPDLTDRFDAVALVRAAAIELGGKGGGGRRDMAQAGGPDGAAADAALAAVSVAMRDTAPAGV